RGLFGEFRRRRGGGRLESAWRNRFRAAREIKAPTPTMTISDAIAARIGSELRWAALNGFNEAGLPTSTEYTRTGSAMFFSCVVPRSLTARSRRDFTCR